ncbi:hypothetical protein H8B09_19215 [Paenibacillus sp. PR3]|uniref:Lipoprotein n=1 Tax=Paenibacillus terricola TaxID=2763503 RepID=A0ABR8MY83_9BACL|nr:hypothetical protein [Paenibacillus terricola]MBD3920904.1 hypothetical protein [Paenibacillus terricola]
MYTNRLKESSVIFFVLIIVFFTLTACGNHGTKPNFTDSVTKGADENSRQDIVEDKDQLLINPDDVRILATIDKFKTAIKTPDLQLLKEIIHPNGLYSMTYFTDGRDPNVGIHVDKEKLREDLVLESTDGYLGITLPSMGFRNNDDLQTDIPIQRSEFLQQFSLNIDWQSLNEVDFKNSLDALYQKLLQIIVNNNKDIAQVFALKDDYYAFTKSSAIFDPYTELTGNWAVFHKEGQEFKLVSVIELT